MKDGSHNKKHWIRLILTTFAAGLVLSGVLYLKTIHYIYGQTCFTPQTVSSDTRCLYILQGKVYEKGTRSKAHQGTACGTDVTSVIPSFHFGNLPKYIDPNFVGNICTLQASPTPTVGAPTATRVPTQSTVPTNTPAVPTTGANCATKANGDADCNGVYDSIDFEIWRKEKMHELFTKNADFNGDNVDDIIDFEIWRKSAKH